VTGVSDDYEWVGPFLACPDGETLDAFEVNINFQSGLVRYTDQGNKRSMPVRLVIQYRKVGTTTWQQSPFYSRSTENQIGFTHRYNVSPGSMRSACAAPSRLRVAAPATRCSGRRCAHG
jgi:hypothetical protein